VYRSVLPLRVASPAWLATRVEAERRQHHLLLGNIVNWLTTVSTEFPAAGLKFPALPQRNSLLSGYCFPCPFALLVAFSIACEEIVRNFAADRELPPAWGLALGMREPVGSIRYSE
jgi:hypothetical protein